MGPKTEGPNEYLKVIVASFGWILGVWCSASEQSYYCGAVRLRPGLVDKSHGNYDSCIPPPSLGKETDDE